MNKRNKKFEDPQVMFSGLAWSGVGVLLAFIPCVIIIDSLVAVALFTTGIGLAMFGVAQIFLGVYWTEVARKHLEKRIETSSNSGVIWIWAVCLAGIVMYSIAYYALVYPALMMIGIVEGLVVFDAQATVTLNLVRAVLNWHPIFFILGMLLWGFVNSARREVQTYPM